MIQVKDTSVLESLLTQPAHYLLVRLVIWACVRFSQVIFTLGYEKRDYPSVHSTIPFRGMDIRSTVFDDPQAVVDDINTHWVYDPQRPAMKCAVYHDTGRGPHIHLQVCDSTVTGQAYTWDQFLEYGKQHTDNLVNGMPWSFEFIGKPVTHENDTCYLISDGINSIKMTPHGVLVITEFGSNKTMSVYTRID